MKTRCHVLRCSLVLEGMKQRISTGEALLAAAVIVHLGATVAHGVFHSTVDVRLAPPSIVFVLVVIWIGPIVGLALQRTILRRGGSWIIAASLAGALVFGVANHFVIPGADHVSHVVGPWSTWFGMTAVLLSLTETVGSGLALWCATHPWR
jgi:hypothetical protein